MNPAKRIDRKAFLSLGLATTSVWAFGCSDDAETPVGAAGSNSGGTGALGGSAGAGGSTATAGTSAGGGGAGGSGAGGGGAGGGGAGGAGAGGAGAGGGGAGGAAGGTGGAAGGGGSGGMVAADCSAQLKVTITANHDHVLNVTLADVMAGVAKAYDVKGGSEHPHWVELTAADFTKLQMGGTVRKLTCDRGHEHEYIVNCVGNATPTETPSKPMYCDAEHKCGETSGNYCQTLP